MGVAGQSRHLSASIRVSAVHGAVNFAYTLRGNHEHVNYRVPVDWSRGLSKSYTYFTGVVGSLYHRRRVNILRRLIFLHQDFSQLVHKKLLQVHGQVAY